MNVRIKSSGNSLNDSEIENIATEETLSKIYEHLVSLEKTIEDISGSQHKENPLGKKIDDGNKTNNTILGRIYNLFGKKQSEKVTSQKDSGDASNKRFSSALSTAIPSLQKISPLFASLSEMAITFEAAHLLSNAFHSIIGTSGLLINTFITGKTSMSDFTAAIAKGTAEIPVFGMLFSIINSGVKAIDDLNSTLYDLNLVGASFNNSLTGMIIGAAHAGMSLTDYASVIKNNASSLAQFGSVMQGVRVFTSVANISMRQYASRLADMGISLEDYQKELPIVLSLFGAAMKAHGASDRDLAQSAINLTQQFDAMAQLTGKTREQQAAELQKMTSDAAWKLKLSQMSGTEAANQLSVLNEINSTMGDTAAELYKMKVLGIVPLSKEMQILMATVPGLDRQMQMLSQSASSSNFNPREMDKRIGDMLESGIKSGAGFEQILNAAASGLDGTPATLAKIQGELLQNKDAFMKNNVFNKVAFEARLSQLRMDEKRGDVVRASLAKWNADIKNLRDVFITTVLAPLLTRLSPIITQIVNVFESSNIQNALKQIFTEISNSAISLGNWVNTHGEEIKEMITGFISIVISIMTAAVSIAGFMFEHTTAMKFVLIGIASVLGMVMAMSAILLAINTVDAIGMALVGIGLESILWPITLVVAGFLALAAGLTWLAHHFGFFGMSTDTNSNAAQQTPNNMTVPAMTNVMPGGGFQTPDINGLIADTQKVTAKPNEYGKQATSVNNDNVSGKLDAHKEILLKILNEMKINNDHSAKTSKGVGQIAAQTA
jgi:hypothetical protein